MTENLGSAQIARAQLAIWLALATICVCGLAGTQGALTAFSLELMTTHGIEENSSAVGPSAPPPRMIVVVKNVVKERRPEVMQVVQTVIGASGVLGVLTGVILVVLFPHWYRLVSVALVLAIGGCVALICWIMWRQAAPDLLGWGTPFIQRHAVAHAVGGLVGVALGRPGARLLTNLIVPRQVRWPFEFLGLTDDKPSSEPTAGPTDHQGVRYYQARRREPSSHHRSRRDVRW